VDPFLTMEVLYQLSYEGAGRSVAALAATPQIPPDEPSPAKWRGQDSNLRRLSQRIYSPSPLTAREPRQGPGKSSDALQIAAAGVRDLTFALKVAHRAVRLDAIESFGKASGVLRA
jgi:hypothetical protein